MYCGLESPTDYTVSPNRGLLAGSYSPRDLTRLAVNHTVDPDSCHVHLLRLQAPGGVERDVKLLVGSSYTGVGGVLFYRR